MAEANNAALYDARRTRKGSSEMMESIVHGSNCLFACPSVCCIADLTFPSCPFQSTKMKWTD
jgi:hypothetical protein